MAGLTIAARTTPGLQLAAITSTGLTISFAYGSAAPIIDQDGGSAGTTLTTEIDGGTTSSPFTVDMDAGPA